MDKEIYKRKNEELKMLISMYCNKIGCNACIHVRYDEDGKETGACKVTDLNNELMCCDVI